MKFKLLIKNGKLDMFTQVDSGYGLVKLYWNDIKERVQNVDSIFSKIVDDLEPDKTFPIYLAYHSFGDLKGDTVSTLFPNMEGGFFRITDSNVHKDVAKHLGYSAHGSPFGMILEKEFEYFIDFKHEHITIPWAIYQPGKFFSFSNYLSQKSTRVYSPNTVLNATAGARSTFILPNIGCSMNHVNLQREFNIQKPPPKYLYEHWNIFKEIVKGKGAVSDWRACVLYFSEKWLEKLYNDKSWLKLKLYLHEQAWNYFEFERCRSFYDIAFSSIQKKKNLKPNPYLTDTARHLFAIALGDAPGFAPASDNTLLPYDLIQKIFVEIYGLKKYLPTIMQPTRFTYENQKTPVYYSLQYPSTFNFSPKSRKTFSTLFEMRELQHIMKTFIHELQKKYIMGSETVIGAVANSIEFNYFHNKKDRHHIIKHTSEMTNFDLHLSASKHKYSQGAFAADASFVRGCVGIKSTA